MLKLNLIYHETKHKNGILRIENFFSDSNFVKEDIQFNFENQLKNKGVVYGFCFHFFFLLFLFSFIKLSLMDPGGISQEYNDIYNVSNYYEYYLGFYNKILLRKNDLNESVSNVSNNSVKENYMLFATFKSSKLLQEKAKKIELEYNNNK